MGAKPRSASDGAVLIPSSLQPIVLSMLVELRPAPRPELPAKGDKYHPTVFRLYHASASNNAHNTAPFHLVTPLDLMVSAHRARPRKPHSAGKSTRRHTSSADARRTAHQCSRLVSMRERRVATLPHSPENGAC